MQARNTIGGAITRPSPRWYGQRLLDIVKALGYIFSADTKTMREYPGTTTRHLSANLARTNVYARSPSAYRPGTSPPLSGMFNLTR